MPDNDVMEDHDTDAPLEQTALAADALGATRQKKVDVRPTLDELLARCDANAEQGPEDQAWLEGAPVGRERI